MLILLPALTDLLLLVLVLPGVYVLLVIIIAVGLVRLFDLDG